MRFGISLPPFGDYADPRYLAAAAKAAEAAGWDGFFIWDHVFFDPSFHPNLDPWVGLTAVALATSHIRIGTLVTPLARRRPWIVARQTVSIDLISDGRLTLGVGLGDPVQWDFGFFGEETDNKLRAEKVEEGLKILAGLWRGDEFSFVGKHYQLQPVTFKPTPVQSPRIPIWIGGTWPNKGPMRRAARYDGYHPLKWDNEGMQPADWRITADYIQQQRMADTPIDLIHSGRVPDQLWSNASEFIAPYQEVGVTWWIEDVSPWRFGHSWEIDWQPEFTRQMDELMRRGPPAMRG